MTLNRCHILLALTLAFSGGLYASELDDILTKARANLGSEQKLEAVESLTYEGRVYGPDGEEQDTLKLIFKKPDKQRLIAESKTLRRATGVNGFEGFIEVINKEDKYKSGIVVLDYNRVRRLLANAAENLYFFNGPYHRRGGEIELLGTQEVRGHDCYKVRFSYACGLYYVRFFDTTTYELISTLNGESNQELVESDTTEVDGIVFPKKVETYDDEGDLIRTVVFEKILINEPVDDSIFDFPDFPGSLER